MANLWTSFNNLPAGLAAETMVLLSDGCVFVHSAYGSDWYRLTPDQQGNYDTGSWTGPFAMANSRQFFASGVLMDGRFFVLGGEDSSAGGDTNLAEIFDPTTNIWSPLANPYSWVQGDCSACILADGRVLFGSLSTTQTAIWDPAANTWVEAGTAFGSMAATKAYRSDEESWTLLPDGSVITISIVNPPVTQKYVPSIDQWVAADQTPATLTQPMALLNLDDTTVPPTGVYGIGEMGPSVFLPTGQLFAIGATGHTALYNPSASPALAGSWSAGADMPADTSTNDFNSPNGSLQTAIDAPCVLLTGGKVLCAVGNTVFEAGYVPNPFWSNPCNLVVYDPATNATPAMLVPQPPSNTADTWTSRFLLLPTGQVLFTTQSYSMQMLTVDTTLLGAPQNAWRPVITGYTPTMNPGNNYALYGYQFNGLSQACHYGDDAQMATNYPIVRLTNMATNDITYVRSFNFSSLGIATGNTTVSTTIAIPASLAPGSYGLEVVANGIPSLPAMVTIVAAPKVYINGGYQSADIIITDLATDMPVPLGGMPGGPWDTLLQPNTQYGFSATIHNSSATAANGVQVDFWAIPGGVGTSGTLLSTVSGVSVPANNSTVVASPVDFTSAASGDHLCAVVSLYNPATGCSVNTGSNALLIPDPGLAGDHECSAWRNTDSMVAGPHSQIHFPIGFGKIPLQFKDEVIHLVVEPIHVPATWRQLAGVKELENVLSLAGAKNMLPLYLLPQVSKSLHPLPMAIHINAKEGGRTEERERGRWHFHHHGREENTALEITGELPGTVKHGDIVLVMITAHYPAVERMRAKAVQFLEVIHVLDR